jgi:hypothetical protein
MSTELKPLQEFFNKRVFRIPDYQRGYAWGESQLEDFWQDLNRIPKGRNHYTGQLTLASVPKDAWERWDEDNWLITARSYKPFYVVDGQQRLTTSVILLKCILDEVPANESLACTRKEELISAFLFCQAGLSKAYLFGYEKDNPSYEYLKTQILGQSDNAYQGTETVYTANLRDARDFFKERLKNKALPELEELFKRLTQRFVFNEYELDEDLEVFVTFETMNNRGKPLSKLELLKNRLIYLSTLAPIDDDQQRSLRRNITNAWKTIYQYLGKESGHPLDDDDFLRAHWIISFAYARDQAEQFAVYLLDRHFTPVRAATGELPASEIQSYVNSIQKAVKAWHAIHFPHRTENIDDGIRSGLERLGRVGRGAFAPLVMAAMLREVSVEEKAGLLAEAERFVFCIRRICNRRANTGDTEFYRLAGQVHRGETTTAEAIAAVRQISNQHFSSEKAQSAMRELYDNDNEGFYSWAGRYYFLFEYEQRLKAKAGMQASKINWDEFTKSKKDHVTVEHIFPRTPVADDWPEFQQRTNLEADILRHSLGNLLALSQSRNSQFSNRAFLAKKQDADGVRGYYNGSYSEIEVSQASKWTPKDVLDRGLSMLGFLEEHWDISLGSRADKVWLLHLEFLEPENVRPPTRKEILAQL